VSSNPGGEHAESGITASRDGSPEAIPAPLTLARDQKRMSFVSTTGTGSRLPAIRWLAFCSVLALAGIAVSSALPSPASQARVVLTVAVTGKGKVTSAPKGIACPSKCRARYPSRTTVRLSVKPASGWTFSRWGGPCAGQKSLICNVRMNAPRDKIAWR